MDLLYIQYSVIADMAGNVSKLSYCWQVVLAVAAVAVAEDVKVKEAERTKKDTSLATAESGERNQLINNTTM